MTSLSERCVLVVGARGQGGVTHSPSVQRTSAQGRGETSAGWAKAPRGHGPALPAHCVGEKGPAAGGREEPHQGRLGWRREGVNSLAPRGKKLFPLLNREFEDPPGAASLGLQEAPLLAFLKAWSLQSGWVGFHLILLEHLSFCPSSCKTLPYK